MAVENRQLLIVEDDNSLKQMLTWEFEDLGYRVTAVGCCEEALVAADRQRFDLALLDYNLPDGLGSELMKALKQRLPRLRIILCSGLACYDPEMRDAFRFVPKPVKAGDLHGLFQQALEQG